MAVPKNKTSKSRSRNRRAMNMRLHMPVMVECNSCGNRVLLHRVCPKCGYYKGRQIIKPE